MHNPSPARLRVVLLGNGLLRVANAASGALIGFYLAALANEGRGTDAALVGALGVVANGAELAAAVPVGALSDRFSPRVLMVGGCLLGAGATQLFGISSVIPVFFLSRTLEGIASAAGGPPLLAHLTDVTAGAPQQRGRVMGQYELALLAGLALGGLLGGDLWGRAGTGAFAMLALVYLVAGAIFFWGMQPVATRSPRRGTFAGLWAALRDPTLRRLAPAWLAMNAIVGMWLTHISFQLSGPEAAGQFLVGRFSPREVGFVLLGYAIVFALGVIGWGSLLGRMSRIRALRIAIVGMLAASLWLYLLNGSTGWPASLRWAVVVLLVVSVLVESGFTPAALAYLADVAGRSEGRGTTMGLYTLLLGVGNVLGAALGGALGDLLALNGLLLATVALATLSFASLALLRE